MNLTAGIRELCFMVLFSPVLCMPLFQKELLLNESCQLTRTLKPKTQLLEPYRMDQGITSKHLEQMNKKLSVEGIPELNKMASMNKTERLLQLRKAFKAFEIYIPQIHIVSNHKLKNYLTFHSNHVSIIINEIPKASDTILKFTPPTSSPKSNFQKKEFGYKVLKLYMMWLDALKTHFCKK